MDTLTEDDIAGVVYRPAEQAYKVTLFGGGSRLVPEGDLVSVFGPEYAAFIILIAGPTHD